MLRWIPLVAIWSVLCSIPWCSTGLAQSSPDIEPARLKGIQFLQGEQFDDGSWEFEGHDVGITSLCALALIENGVPVSDPSIEKAHRFVQEEMKEIKGTYDIALAILLLSRVGDRDNRPKIRELAARLIAGQTVEGGWGYTCPLASVSILSNPNDRPKLQPGIGDNSCTQFAVLGLWVSSRWGVDITETMSLVGDRFIETQREDGGWPYVCEEWSKLVAEAEESETGASSSASKDAEEMDGGAKKKKKKDKDKGETPAERGREKPAVANNPAPAAGKLPGEGEGPLPGANGGPGAEAASTSKYQPSSPSMTFAGLFCLTVARATVIRDEQAKMRVAPEKKGADPVTKADAPTVVEGSTLMEDPSFADGLKRAGEFAATIGPGSARYFMWSVERMGVVLGAEKFGETPWFTKGSSALLASQEMDGAWKNPNEAWGSLADTSFAILFLRKANLGSDISRLLSGEPENRFQIISREERPRFASLEEALKAAQPGDRIRVDGAGPFLLPHVEVNQDLTIEAGYGYQPVFRYDMGYDADGLRSRPQKNAEARHMIRVNQGTLILEGVELQMDPPTLEPGIPWVAVVVNGGTLRLLNCSISEGNKQGMSAVKVTAAGEVLLRNCQIVGGRAGIEIEASGDQAINIENSLIFSKSGVIATNSAKSAEGTVTLTLNRCSVQCNEVFSCKGLTNNLDIQSDGVAYLADAIGMSMLPKPTGHDGLTWTGSENIYDLKKWVGSAGKPIAAVKDAKSWSTYWGGTDTNGSARKIPFVGRKPMGGFNHAVKGEDFEFAANSGVYAYRRKTGIDPLLVGPGAAFLRYRESFEYRTWLSGPTAAIVTPVETGAEQPATGATPK